MICPTVAPHTARWHGFSATQIRKRVVATRCRFGELKSESNRIPEISRYSGYKGLSKHSDLARRRTVEKRASVSTLTSAQMLTTKETAVAAKRTRPSLRRVEIEY